MEYGNLQDDIDYSLRVMVEWQFRWTDEIAQEVQSYSNVSVDEQDFPRHLVRLFSADLNDIFDLDYYEKPGLEFGLERFQPTCEQPTGAAMRGAECANTYSRFLPL